ncbi:MAG: hypothetical protein KC877_04090 [Candidatus Kaiserbacteria bacterium]|nr:hypothetical protein [Candidatus Kaiserbacteria bacterium]MCB9815801.1 hypothetical protein [Candidatus Nomurabacteria bacterium]
MKPRRKKRLDPNTVVLLKHIGMGVLAIGTVALIVTGIWYGSRLSALTITKVDVRGGETIDRSSIEQIVQGALEGNYLGLVPQRFAWFYPEQEILTQLAGIERIHNVSVQRMNGTSLLVTFDEYVPHALWCNSVEDRSCVFLDASGYAFGRAPELSGGALLRFVTSGREVQIGSTVADAEALTTVTSLVSLLADIGWYVSYVELDQAGDVFLKIVDGGELRATTDIDPQETVENFQVILASPEFLDLAPGTFQYVDLRFGNKVFVNEEDETFSESVTATTTPN